MKRKNYRKILFLLLFLFCFLFIGCNNKKLTINVNDSEQEIKFQKEKLNVLEERVIQMKSSSNTFVANTYQNNSEQVVQKLYVSNKENIDLQPIPYEFKTSRGMLIDIDEESNIYVLYREQPGVPFHFFIISKEGQVIKESEIDLESLRGGSEILEMCVDAQGYLYMSDWRLDQLYIYNTTNEGLNVIDPKGTLCCLGKSKTLDFYMHVRTEKAEGVIKTYNVDTGQLDTIIELPDENTIGEFITSSNYDICYKSTDGIWGINAEDNTLKHLLSFELSALDSSYINDLIEIDINQYLCLDSNNDAGIWKLTQNSEKDNRETLTLGGINIPETILSGILLFNQENKQYKISILDYGEYGEEARKKFSTDIQGGKKFDLLCLNNMNAYDVVNKGFLEDLYGYLEQDTKLKKTDLLPGVLRNLEKNQKLYYITPGFWLNTAIGKQALFENENGINTDRIKHIVGQSGIENLYSNLSRRDAFTQLVIANLSSMDSISENPFVKDKNILKSYLSLTQDFLEDESTVLFQDVIEKDALLTNLVCMDLNDFLLMNRVFKEEINFVGNPVEVGNGNRLNSMGMNIGIYVNSDYKDAAWTFIKSLLDAEFQFKYCYPNYFPSNQKCMERILKVASATDEYVDESGIRINPYRCEMEYDGFEYIIEAMTDEEKSKFYKLLDSTEREFQYDDELLSIILEEAEDYFSGNKELDAVVENIHNRVKLYCQEKEL